MPGPAPASLRLTEEEAAREEATLTAELGRLTRLHDLEVLRRKVAEARSRLTKETDIPPPDEGAVRERNTPDSSVPTPRGSQTLPQEDTQLSKRARVDDDQVDVPRPGRYKGGTRQELVEWLRTCEQLFEVKSATYEHDRTKVTMAQGYLSGAPQNSWWRKKEAGDTESMSWKDFKKFLEDDLRPETLRGLDVRRLYHAAKQLPGQSVHDWATYLETLEAQMPPFQENQRSEKFLFGLHKALQDHLLESRADTSNRNRLIETAMLIDETQGRARRVEDMSRLRRLVPRTGPTQTERGPATPAMRTVGLSAPNSRPTTDKGQAQCRYCGFRGHFERECRKKARDESDKTEPHPKARAQ